MAGRKPGRELWPPRRAIDPQTPGDEQTAHTCAAAGLRGTDSRLALRRAIIDPKMTDAFRLIHGAADGWPGLYIDKLGGFFSARSIRGPAFRRPGRATPRMRDPVRLARQCKLQSVATRR